MAVDTMALDTVADGRNGLLASPSAADRLIAALPGGDLLPDDMRQRLITFLRDTI